MGTPVLESTFELSGFNDLGIHLIPGFGDYCQLKRAEGLAFSILGLKRYLTIVFMWIGCFPRFKQLYFLLGSEGFPLELDFSLRQ